MSENQRAGTSVKEQFFQLFNYDDKASPFGASLDEMLKSCPYTESSPTKISVCFGNLEEHSLFSLYSCYINFAQKYSNIDAIQECIFPLFCHIVMYFRKNEADRLQVFINEYLKTVPQKFRDEVDDFLKFDQADTYNKLSILFSTQLYIVKCTMTDYKILNNFLNDTSNFQLKRYIADIITIEIIQKEVVDKLPTTIFPNKSPTSNLSILNIKMKEASCASILSDLSSIFISVYDTQICRIDTCKRKYQQLYSHSSVVTSMSISNTSKLLLTTDILGNAILYTNKQGSDMVTPNDLRKIDCHTPIWCSTFAPQGGVFALGTHDKLIRLYDPTTKDPFRFMVGHVEPVKTVLFHPNCSLLGSLSCDASLRIWDIRRSETDRIFIGRPQKNCALSFSPNGKVAAFYDGDIQVCDIGSGKFIMPRKDSHSVKNAEFTCFSDDSRFLYVVCSDGRITSFDLNDGNFTQTDICRLEANVLSCKMLKSELVVATAAKQSDNEENSDSEKEK
ncbi:hypothetical protein M9Y10_032856 [Tritrichomonas musculus]|uniref:TFIID subunit TAF5 NTD2 domain-containing protein n=1 Tax=Tritrichomonas musculus TaxID=1915356 RepID=A0ABR2GZL7_9EUKA